MDGFNFNSQKQISFGEVCIKGKHHRSPFPVGGATRAKGVLDLVHTDVCGRLSPRSVGGAEYFVVFVDDKSQFVWVHVLKSKSEGEVIAKFCEWKAMVELATGQKKMLRSDNRDEYTSREFVEHLKTEGIHHELTVSKSPQQNGVAEWLHCPLIKMTRSMLTGSKLPHKLWAEAFHHRYNMNEIQKGVRDGDGCSGIFYVVDCSFCYW